MKRTDSIPNGFSKISTRSLGSPRLIGLGLGSSHWPSQRRHVALDSGRGYVHVYAKLTIRARGLLSKPGLRGESFGQVWFTCRVS
jgi:hypothetical protein